MTTAEEKKLLRRKLRQQARSLSAGEKAISDGKIINRLLTLPAYHRAGTVFCFVSTPWEIDTRPLLDDVLATGRRLCVPRALAGGHMELAVIRSMDDLTPGAYDILEPRAGCTLLTAGEVDFAVIPCLSCDRGGHRLGQGGGYYDRFLADYAGDTVLLCREALLQEKIPTEVHDVRLPWIITELGVFPCDGGSGH